MLNCILAFTPGLLLRELPSAPSGQTREAAFRNILATRKALDEEMHVGLAETNANELASLRNWHRYACAGTNECGRGIR